MTSPQNEKKFFAFCLTRNFLYAKITKLTETQRYSDFLKVKI